jgi:hypothetical protein
VSAVLLTTKTRFLLSPGRRGRNLFCNQFGKARRSPVRTFNHKSSPVEAEPTCRRTKDRWVGASFADTPSSGISSSRRMIMGLQAEKLDYAPVAFR